MRAVLYLFIAGFLLGTSPGYAASADAGLDRRTLTHLAIEESQIDSLLAERGVFGGYEDD